MERYQVHSQEYRLILFHQVPSPKSTLLIKEMFEYAKNEIILPKLVLGCMVSDFKFILN